MGDQLSWLEQSAVLNQYKVVQFELQIVIASNSKLYFIYEVINMSSENVTKFRQKRKQDLVYVHGNRCAICGYDKCIGALQFHHINPQDKQFGLSSGICHSWEQDIEESKKCILVCANCHAEIHNGIIEEELHSSFNESKYLEKSQELSIEQHKCKRCGKSITTGATYCRECWSFLNRKKERPNREELKQKIRFLSFSEIGREYEVSDNAIRKWCDDYKLPRTKTKINSYTDEEWEQI